MYLVTELRRDLKILPVMVIALGLLTACGFQLRGAVNLSADVAPIAIQRNNLFDLGSEIRSVLEINKIEVTESMSAAKSIITLINESQARRVLSVDGSGRASEYLLIYSVRYSLESQSFETAEFTARQQRSLVFDPDAVLAVENEAEMLYGDMRKDVARLILMKLQAKSAAR
jgi:LPS-assembly lipoprotein